MASFGGQLFPPPVKYWACKVSDHFGCPFLFGLWGDHIHVPPAESPWAVAGRGAHQAVNRCLLFLRANRLRKTKFPLRKSLRGKVFLRRLSLRAGTTVHSLMCPSACVRPWRLSGRDVNVIRVVVSAAGRYAGREGAESEARVASRPLKTRRKAKFYAGAICEVTKQDRKR